MLPKHVICDVCEKKVEIHKALYYEDIHHKGYWACSITCLAVRALSFMNEAEQLMKFILAAEEKVSIQ